MAFQAKTDYCGIATLLSDAVVLRDDAENASTETYAPQGQDGSIVAIEAYGADSAPTNNYGVKADIELNDGDIALNAITSVGGKNYALESIQITTGAGVAPTISTTAQLIEASATDAAQCKYEVPALELSVKQHAQILFDAFTLTGAGCQLTACSATIGCVVTKDKVAGVIIGSDANSGLITVSGTILQTGSTAPTLAAANSFVITQAPNCTNPEAAYKSYTFELQLPLAKTEHSS